METPKRAYSLHLGLNAVDPAHYAGWDGQLSACEADAEDMLVIANFNKFTQSLVLKTKEATRDRVIREIKQAAAELRAGDLFLLSYSGHGGQVPDRNGDEDDFEDETWCLYDGQLIDDELDVLWQGFREGVRVFLLSDSCHSGTVSRRIQAGVTGLLGPQGARGPETPRFRAMPPDAATRTYQRNKAFYDELQAAIPAVGGAIKATVRLISGCHDNQLSSDGTFNGLFTSTLLRVWHGGGFQGNYVEFHEAIVRLMPPDQTPQHSVIGKPDQAYDAQRPFQI
jgi:hypothetical protein